MRLAYLTGRYPEVSHTFVMREVRALRALGAGVETFSIWRTDESQLLAPADREEHATTYAVLPLRPLHAIGACVRAVGRAPRAYAAMAARALRLARPGVRGRLLGASWTLEAVILWDRMRRREARHVHVHLNGTAPFVALLLCDFANRAAGRREWTWSLTVHGPSEFYDVQGERLAEKVAGADLVVCISDFARSQLMALVDESEWDKLHVVHCGIDLDTFPAVDRSSNGKAPLRLLTVGRLVQVKGQAVLLQAIADLAARGVDVELTMVGDGPKRAALERIASDLRVEDRVRFAGSVGQDRIPQYFQDADAFVMSSFAEGIPVVLMEAMATQLPVIAPAVMGIPELVRHEVNGLLVRPSRADQLADAVAALAADRARRDELGRAGRATVAEEFDVHASARRLHASFARLAGGGRL